MEKKCDFDAKLNFVIPQKFFYLWMVLDGSYCWVLIAIFFAKIFIKVSWNYFIG
eukprot:TRINITY_DN7685_c0_g1_i1.p1 TRINITY_DN7685_c0_g1~~TRINITY_DN7685_c0_g1_i1.p1  ORF type:complete len:54 (-),score=7.37 TRINITY_DN7685_c0_g1_i1:165-326(-)